MQDLENDEFNLENAILLVDSNRGIYGPQSAMNCLDNEKVTIDASAEDIEIVKSGPDHSEYWDAWDMILNCVLIVKETGKKYNFYQDGDIWLIPVNQ